MSDPITQASALAINTAANAWSFASDFAIVIVLLVVLFMFCWYVGRGPFIALITSIYVGYALYALFPYLAVLPTAPALTALGAKLILFIALCVVSYLILRRTAASDFVSMSLFGQIMLALLGSGLIIVLLYQAFPTREVYHFTPILNTLFAPKEYFFYWFIAPLLGLFFLAR